VDIALDAVEPTEWDENHLSILVVQSIREVLRRAGQIELETGVLRLAVEAYKFTGTPERCHGDIAVAIHHFLDDGREITGLGFYEAKAADMNGRYPAFKLRQLKRLFSATPRLSLLLYERMYSTATSEPFGLGIAPHSRSDRQTRRVRARTVGANIVTHLKDPGRSAELYAESFGFHFVSRYLTGRDLDYSRSPAESLNRWLQKTKRAPPIVIALAVSNLESVVPQLQLADYEPLALPCVRTPLLTSPG
jgi:hypothetical protein